MEVYCLCAANLLLGFEACWCFEVGECKNFYVLCFFAHFGEFYFQELASRYVCARFGKISHSLVGFNPRSAALTPSRAVEYAYFYAEVACCFERGVQNFPPFRRIEFHFSIGYVVAAYVANLHTVYAYALHGLKIFYNAFFGNVVGHPVPVNRYLLRIGDTAEC